MTSPSAKKTMFPRRGFTLIECVIYIGLVSYLLAGFVSFASATSMTAFRLMDSIHDHEQL